MAKVLATSRPTTMFRHLLNFRTAFFPRAGNLVHLRDLNNPGEVQMGSLPRTIDQASWKMVDSHSLFKILLLVVLLYEISRRIRKILDLSPLLVLQWINNECHSKAVTHKINHRIRKADPLILKVSHHILKVNKLLVFPSPQSRALSTTNGHPREINRNRPDLHERLHLPQC
jgi:hypothetical protein